MGAVSFISPAILLAALSLPLIWWLMRATPPAPTRVRFPAFFLLRKLTADKETPDKTPWWLLLLRLLLTAAIILALAGPVLNAPETEDKDGPIVMVIDDSWAAAAHWALRRDAIKMAAEEASRADRPIYLITTSPKLRHEELKPMTGNEAGDMADAMEPAPFLSDRGQLIDPIKTLAENVNDADVRWLADGLAGEHDEGFTASLEKLGEATIYLESAGGLLALSGIQGGTDRLTLKLARPTAGAAREGNLVAIARDGRELVRQNYRIENGAASAVIEIDLPLALQNEISYARLDNVSSAGAVYLFDARNRRTLIGLPKDSQSNEDALLSGLHYVRRALSPYASFLSGRLAQLLESDVSVIILDDVGRLRRGDIEALKTWVERGGVLIRFAGPNLAEATNENRIGEAQLLPVPLRGGGRALGGALTWDTPQLLGGFSTDGPFAGLVTPDDAFVRRQVLASPGGTTTERTWASLSDGTPLVTGINHGKGVIALFHTTATPGWSDIPISEVFVDMLRRLTALSSLGAPQQLLETDARFQPIRTLDGAGRLSRPGPDIQGISLDDAANAATPLHPPGFYGSPTAPIAMNALDAGQLLAPLSVSRLPRNDYSATPPRRLAGWFFSIALILLVADGLATLMLSGRLRRTGGAVACALLSVAIVAPNDAHAGPVDTPISKKAQEAALQTRLAFVETGNPSLDRLSRQGLGALSRELTRRTAVEPGSPAGVDPSSDDLSLYPLIYWPITPGAGDLTEEALANIESYMRLGGMILFDTRDEERALPSVETPEGAALKQILTSLDVPPLIPLPRDHVLTRSFFLVDDLPGRTRINPVWVAAASTGVNDGVTPLIIGGRDWAGAWARNDFGAPVRPMSRGGERAREMAYRGGVNIAMVAFTGNYKSDQVHTPILLERLGR